MDSSTRLHPDIFPEICRTCLQRGEMHAISDLKTGGKTASELLSLYAAVQIESEDSFPKNLCLNCVDELVRTHSFVVKCKESQEALQNVQIKIDKEEIDSDTGNETDEEYADKSLNLGGGTYKCTSCELSFSGMNEFRAHKREADHSVKLGRTCNVCGKTFGGLYLLRQHMRSHTKEKPYECDVCDACFSNCSNLIRHKKIHTGEKPHVCDICGKAFTQSSVLNEHKMAHAGEKPYVCTYCGKAFRAYANYKTHLMRHKIENGELPEEERQKELEDYRCKICSRILSTKGALKMHMLIHGEKLFLCNHCGKGFVNKSGLRSHCRVHSGEKPYKCSLCDKEFSLQGTLRQHELIHSGQKPHKCKLCPKAFVQHHQLQYHMRTHSGERPYVCPYCSKSFALNGNLKVHIRTHTGERPYHCPVCSRAFCDSSSMKKHAKGHGDAINQCS